MAAARFCSGERKTWHFALKGFPPSVWPVTHKNGRKYPYYVCSRHTRDGCPHGQWLSSGKLELNVYWALQRIKPQDLEAQIQELIDKERAPESEIKAEYALLEGWPRSEPG